MDPYWFFPVGFLLWDSLCGSGAGGVEREVGKVSITPEFKSKFMTSLELSGSQAVGSPGSEEVSESWTKIVFLFMSMLGYTLQYISAR